MDWDNSSLIDSLIARDFAVIDGALDEPLWTSWARRLESRFAELPRAGIGRGAARVERTDVRGDHILWLDDRDPEMAPAMAWLESGRRQLGRELRLALRSVEAHFAAYPPGAGYDLHIDQSGTHGGRVLTFILYLNEDWTTEDGGELELHLGNDEPPRIIAPFGGRLVLFRSKRFPHRVCPARRLRKSLTGWFRDDDPVLGG